MNYEPGEASAAIKKTFPILEPLNQWRIVKEWVNIRP
jgi:hypothetical protein